MKQLISIISLLLLTSCSAMMPDLFKTVDDIETDTAIKIEVDKTAFSRDVQTVDATVHIQNKDK